MEQGGHLYGNVVRKVLVTCKIGLLTEGQYEITIDCICNQKEDLRKKSPFLADGLYTTGF